MTDLDAQMLADAPDHTDKLAAIRDRIARRRDVDFEIKDAEQRVSDLKAEKRALELEVLPTMFAEVGVDSLGLPASGNLPAVQASLGPYCHASIPASWPAEKKRAAFDVLQRLGVGGLVRRTVTVELPPGDPRWQQVADFVVGLDLTPRLDLTVPWQTLTAAVRDLMAKPEASRPTAGDLDAIGAFVGRIVKLKEQK